MQEILQVEYIGINTIFSEWRLQRGGGTNDTDGILEHINILGECGGRETSEVSARGKSNRVGEVKRLNRKRETEMEES